MNFFYLLSELFGKFSNVIVMVINMRKARIIS